VNLNQTRAIGANLYSCNADLASLEAKLLALAEMSATAAFTSSTMGQALSSGLENAASLMRAVPIQEGHLLEKGIALLAGLNPDLVCLTENIRLPITSAALQVVENNDSQLYRGVSLDADMGGRKGYTPDMLLVHRKAHLAYIVDVKRTLSSYETTRVAALKTRMLASSLVVPDLLYKEQRRLTVNEVRVVILTADGQKADVDNGVWPLADLDHLLEIDGAGIAIERLRSFFTAAIERNWRDACKQLAKIDGRGPQSETAGRGSEGSDHNLTGLDANPKNEDGSETGPSCVVPANDRGMRSASVEDSPSSSAPPLRVGLARRPQVNSLN
jgi:hypothetical protein